MIFSCHCLQAKESCNTTAIGSSILKYLVEKISKSSPANTVDSKSSPQTMLTVKVPPYTVDSKSSLHTLLTVKVLSIHC